MIWSSETDLWEAFGWGDVWIAYAWPNDWVQMKTKKLKVVYMHPKEKPIAWVGMFMLLKGSPRPQLAHCLRQRLELDEVGEVARGQLRLRPREHDGPPIVERPAARAAADQPAGRHGAERAPRPRHPATRACTRGCGNR